jgi:PAS domain S-box-containing protein
MVDKQWTGEQLRRHAEERLQGSEATDHGAEPAVLEGESQRLIHELRVHQIELEIQHEVLIDALAEANRMRMKYHDLYEFAPVGYFTLAMDGTIVEVNLRGAAMLDSDRDHLVGNNLRAYFGASSLAEVDKLLERARQSAEETVAHKLLLRRHWPMPLYVNAQARAYHEPNGPKRLRLVLMDVTALKMATDDVVRIIEKTAGQGPL